MAYPIVHIEYQVKDSKKAMEWYCDLFGWGAQYDENLKYGMFSTGEGQLGGGFADQGMTGTVVYIGVDDIPAILAKVEAKGGKIIRTETPIPGMGAFGLAADPDGNVIGLFKATQP
jgi:hypothetical protein